MPLWDDAKCQAALKTQFGPNFVLPSTSICAGAEGRDACDVKNKKQDISLVYYLLTFSHLSFSSSFFFVYSFLFVLCRWTGRRETEEDLLYVKKKVSGSRWVSSVSASAVGGPICRAFTRDSRLSTDGSTRRSAVSKPCPVNKIGGRRRLRQSN